MMNTLYWKAAWNERPFLILFLSLKVSNRNPMRFRDETIDDQKSFKKRPAGYSRGPRHIDGTSIWAFFPEPWLIKLPRYFSRNWSCQRGRTSFSAHMASFSTTSSTYSPTNQTSPNKRHNSSKKSQKRDRRTFS